MRVSLPVSARQVSHASRARLRRLGLWPRAIFNRAPCATRAVCASMRYRASARFAARASHSADILGVCIYAFGSQSCAARLDWLRCARLTAAKLAAHGTSGVRRACDRSRPRSRSPRRRSRRLRGVSRRDASSVEYNLLASRRAPPRIRRTASPRVAQLGARPLAALPQLPIGALLSLHPARLRLWLRRLV